MKWINVVKIEVRYMISVIYYDKIDIAELL